MRIVGRSRFAQGIRAITFLCSFIGCNASPSLMDTASQRFPDVEMGSFTSIYGPLVVEEGVFTYLSDIVPWSGYWHPLSRIDASSALAKYDYLTGRRSLEFEETRIRNENRPYLPWEGRCDAWSFASIFIPKPTTVKEVIVGARREKFSIAEQKALWIYSHESIEPNARTIFGERNYGDNSGAFDDFSPAEFHRILQVILQKEARPFIMDRDPRPPVWNTPVFGAKIYIEKDPVKVDSLHVTAWVQTVFPYDFDTSSTDRIAPVLKYTYDLEVYPSSLGLVVFGSSWTGQSKLDHPDFVTVPVLSESAKAKSLNTEIDFQWLEDHF